MKRFPVLSGVSLLLRHGIDMFYDFQCNHIAGKVMRERLALVAWIFGDPYYGLVPYLESFSVSTGLIPFSDLTPKSNRLVPFSESFPESTKSNGLVPFSESASSLKGLIPFSESKSKKLPKAKVLN